MQKEERRILTEEEKIELLEKHKSCYICDQTLEGYSREEIQFDHIYSFVGGYSQELNNFAPVHASSDKRKSNCHADKGRKMPIDYREEVRVKQKLGQIHGLADLCPKAIKSTYSLAPDKKTIVFNGITLPIYNQKISGRDNFYFFHEIDIKYIENDSEIQLRPLEAKILPLIFNLKTSVQLLPSLARLDSITNTVKLFDGQHKAVAQIIGNNREQISCIVFVAPDVNALRVTVYEAHTDFVQQRYKKSHIDAKLADIYFQKIEAFRKRVGNPQAPYSEQDILKGLSAAEIRKFLIASIIDQVKQSSNIDQYTAESRVDQKQRPILWQSLERFIAQLCNLKPVAEISENPNNHRADEIDNLIFIWSQIEEYALKNNWNPDNPESAPHKMARTYFYVTAFNNWINTLTEGLKFSQEQMKGAKIYNAICYQEAFQPDIRSRFSSIIKRLFEHPLWVQPAIQNEIAKTNQDSFVTNIFKREGLDYIYLTKLSD